MTIDYSDIIKGVYEWGIKDKVRHDGIVTKNPFQVGETVTGGTSGRTATITYVGNKHFDYTLTNANLQFTVNEVITGSISNAFCNATVINQLHTTILDKLYFEEVYEDDLSDLLPYVTFDLISSAFTSYFTGDYETFLLGFYAYSDSSSSTQLTNMVKQITDLYHKADFPINNRNLKCCRVTNVSKISRDPNKVWSAIVSAELIIG